MDVCACEVSIYMVSSRFESASWLNVAIQIHRHGFATLLTILLGGTIFWMKEYCGWAWRYVWMGIVKAELSRLCNVVLVSCVPVKLAILQLMYAQFILICAIHYCPVLEMAASDRQKWPSVATIAAKRPQQKGRGTVAHIWTISKRWASKWGRITTATRRTAPATTLTSKTDPPPITWPGDHTSVTTYPANQADQMKNWISQPSDLRAIQGCLIYNLLYNQQWMFLDIKAFRNLAATRPVYAFTGRVYMNNGCCSDSGRVFLLWRSELGRAAGGRGPFLGALV